MQYYVALFTATGEFTAPDYARQLVTFGIVGGRTANVAHVNWTPETDWGTAVQLGLFTEATGGVAVYEAMLTETAEMLTGSMWQFLCGKIVFPEGIYDTSLLDETQFDQAELGTTLPQVELTEFTLPPPSGIRVLAWARRTM